ncbi:GNAT family N-acetyltransferase [Clostridium tertium]|uniref:Ribosomal-protein-S5-alanine N-acetyltransferase n=2 Tax=Clostridium tertium TaxID=1559 RepID=A0A6N3GCN2_9CLOT
MRDFFMETERVGFSNWTEDDIELAIQLWGDKDVTKFICATGEFTDEDISKRLETEVNNNKKYNVQYWPIFELLSYDLIGCCGVRPFISEYNTYEIGFHLCKKYWGKGYAFEASKAVINYCLNELKVKKLYAGHHPKNNASKNILLRLGFHYIGDNFYEPTGLYHPSYEIKNPRL